MRCDPIICAASLHATVAARSIRVMPARGRNRYTSQVDAIGALNVLEAIRLAGLESFTRVYQASTSELFGKVAETPQRETTPFYPRSPYAVAKLAAFWTCVNYREAYGIFGALLRPLRPRAHLRQPPLTDPLSPVPAQRHCCSRERHPL